MDLGWILRMTQWVRHPPSSRQVRFMLAAVALCLIVVGVEHVWGWPDWLHVNGPRLRLPKP